VSSVTAVFIVFAVVVVSSAGSGAPPARQASPMAPDFTVALLSQQAPGQHSPGQSGQHVTLSARYRNKPVIVNFWASWCDPCQQETPLLAGWHRRHPAVNLIGIDENDSAASAEKFAKAKGVTYLLGFDPRITVASAFGVQGAGIPQTFFLNARHQIVDRAYGALTEAGLNRGLRLMNP
jgi:cytochrome c biogenesis protein CcmG/thiol:disulfide interchange protein DsbE